MCRLLCLPGGGEALRRALLSGGRQVRVGQRVKLRLDGGGVRRVGGFHRVDVGLCPLRRCGLRGLLANPSGGGGYCGLGAVLRGGVLSGLAEEVRQFVVEAFACLFVGFLYGGDGVLRAVCARAHQGAGDAGVRHFPEEVARGHVGGGVDVKALVECGLQDFGHAFLQAFAGGILHQSFDEAFARAVDEAFDDHPLR